MKGGISYISKRNSHCGEDKSIMYWNANNLYGFAMIPPNMLYCGFKFMDEKEINKFDLVKISKDSKIGYILEVDLE